MAKRWKDEGMWKNEMRKTEFDRAERGTLTQLECAKLDKLSKALNGKG